MKASTHIRFGYLTQLTSLITLSLVNIALPNALGVVLFTSLNQAMAFISLSCVVFNEAVAYLVIRHMRDTNTSFKDSGNILIQAAFEHSILGLGGLLIVLAIVGIGESNQYSGKEWLLVCGSIFLIAAYIPFVAVLIATLRNHVVMGLALTHGVLGFIMPLSLWWLGGDVRYSIPLAYGLCLAWCIGYFRKHGIAPVTWRVNLKQRLIINKGVFPLAAPTLFRISITWIPVIMYAQIGDLTSAAVYKIATSVAIGTLALVPFHKPTMLSVDKHAGQRTTADLATAAIVVAGAGTLTIAGVAEPLTHILYRVEYATLVQFLQILAPFILLQTLIDIGLVDLIARGRDARLLMLCTASALLPTLGLGIFDLRWYPVLSGLTFVSMMMFNGRERTTVMGNGKIFAVACICLGGILTYIVGGLFGMCLGLILLGVLVFVLPITRHAIGNTYYYLIR